MKCPPPPRLFFCSAAAFSTGCSLVGGGESHTFPYRSLAYSFVIGTCPGFSFARSCCTSQGIRAGPLPGRPVSSGDNPPPWHSSFACRFCPCCAAAWWRPSWDVSRRWPLKN
uniref:(northern house mosquito) hypothetical protein n=1 Tax=Culex pipiens TaxID=7175 RepID=A0A8D8CGX4_CULPI